MAGPVVSEVWETNQPSRFHGGGAYTTTTS